MQIAVERWDDLRVVLAIARGGSMKQAGATLGVNVSTVARRLDALEERLGHFLFDRTPDGTVPTAATEALLPFAEAMEHAAHGAANALDGLEREVEGVVRLTAPPGLIDHFFGDLFVTLAERHPKLRVEMISSIGYADLTRREADLAVRAIRPAVGDLVAVRLVHDVPYAVVASPEVAAEHDGLRDARRARWTTYTAALDHLPETAWTVAQAGDQLVLRTDSFTTQLQSVRAGLGLMVAPEPYAELEGVAAVRLSPKLRRSLAVLPRGTLWLVGHRALRHVPRVAVVWDALLEAFDVSRSRGRRLRGARAG